VEQRLEEPCVHSSSLCGATTSDESPINQENTQKTACFLIWSSSHPPLPLSESSHSLSGLINLFYSTNTKICGDFFYKNTGSQVIFI
ncbi:hypothetical protein KC950_04025, partial [Candidatus Saccharibacteria bacterium]|nr:hypothetical protein [Candidatus Saccharibacteria bacterium]